MAIALWWFWLERGYLSDGRRWVDALLALDSVEGQTGEAPHKLPARTKAYLLRVSGILAMAQGDYDRAVTLYKEAISAYREMGHKKGVSARLRDLGFVPTRRETTNAEQKPALLRGDLALTSSRLTDGTVRAEVARRQADGTRLWAVDQPAIVK